MSEAVTLSLGEGRVRMYFNFPPMLMFSPTCNSGSRLVETLPECQFPDFVKYNKAGSICDDYIKVLQHQT
jgi:hypothetical protein